MFILKVKARTSANSKGASPGIVSYRVQHCRTKRLHLVQMHLILELLQQTRLATLQWKSTTLFQILVCLPEHPYSERELKVRI